MAADVEQKRQRYWPNRLSRDRPRANPIGGSLRVAAVLYRITARGRPNYDDRRSLLALLISRHLVVLTDKRRIDGRKSEGQLSN